MDKNKRAELDYIFNFINEGFFDQDIECDQLRSLWTAFCLHNNLDVDTVEYDNILFEIWESVASTEKDNAFWDDFCSFDVFMGFYLC